MSMQARRMQRSGARAAIPCSECRRHANRLIGRAPRAGGGDITDKKMKFFAELLCPTIMFSISDTMVTMAPWPRPLSSAHPRHSQGKPTKSAKKGKKKGASRKASLANTGLLFFFGSSSNLCSQLAVPVVPAICKSCAALYTPVAGTKVCALCHLALLNTLALAPPQR